MDDAFLSALFPALHRVLGRQLRPYSHGHVVTLHAIASPLVAAVGAGAELDAGQLLAALQVCAAPGYPLLRPDQVRPGLREVLLRWWLARRPARLRAAAEAFIAYRDDHSSFPEFYEQEDLDGDEGARPTMARLLTAPIALARVCSLIGRTTVTLEQAWQMPVALPAWYAGTLNEMEGGARFSSPADDVDDDLPDLDQMSERELYKLTVANLGKARADQWRRDRRSRQRREKRQRSKEEERRGS